MKKILLIAAVLFANRSDAQILDTVRVQGPARKFREDKNTLIIFETVDSTDANGAKAKFSRGFYFDKKRRTLSSVREYSNPSNPARGTQVVYNFGLNRLTKVSVTPSVKVCRNCSSEYYFSGDTLTSKSEKVYRSSDPLAFVSQANAFRSRVPDSLAWGYFNDEKIINGKKKKTARQY
ncbi:MAG: hypothetical protein EOP49_25675 [Sphingobacteriales bacterium]|nr:MAG: hypothetical protein EOP49_25675 [Sphingobacteriales bacterium]